MAGAGTGAAIGSEIYPGIGTAVGAVVGAGVGFLTTPSSKGNPDLPPVVDPDNVKLLEELYTRRKAIENGMSSEFMTGRELISRGEATVLRNIQLTAGGDVASAVSAAERALEASGESISKMVSGATQMAAPYTQMIQELTEKMSQRRLELGLAAYSQNMADVYQQKEDVNANLSAVLSSSALWDSLRKGATSLSQNLQFNNSNNNSNNSTSTYGSEEGTVIGLATNYSAEDAQKQRLLELGVTPITK